jgi:hypothetical protein
MQQLKQAVGHHALDAGSIRPPAQLPRELAHGLRPVRAVALERRPMEAPLRSRHQRQPE